jgi:hypothetical protein
MNVKGKRQLIRPLINTATQTLSLHPHFEVCAIRPANDPDPHTTYCHPSPQSSPHWEWESLRLVSTSPFLFFSLTDRHAVTDGICTGVTLLKYVSDSLRSPRLSRTPSTHRLSTPSDTTQCLASSRTIRSLVTLARSACFLSAQ